MTKIRSCRFLSLLLAILLVVGLVPTAALAAELPDEECHCEDCEAEASLILENELEIAPEDAPASEPEVPASGLKWELEDGLLYIYGSGNIEPFSSEDDQPWKDLRSEIFEVEFDEAADMTVESLAYWFSGCANLQRADLPGYISEIGYHAFYDCHVLHDVMLCCTELPKIVQGSFVTNHPLEWETNYDPRLQFVVRNADVMEALCEYDWTTDSTPVHIKVRQAQMKLLAAAPAAKAAPALAASASGTCGSCGVTCAYTLGYSQWTDSIHCIRHWCSNCGKDQCGGVLGEDHTFSNSGTCTKCGYYSSSHDHSVCYHTSTYTTWSGCNWYKYCRDCGQLVDWGVSHGSTYTTWSGCHWYDYCRDCGELMDSGVSHSYSYGSWEYYNTTRHRRAATCTSCGETTYDYGNHSKKNTAVPYNSTQHKYGSYCAACQSFIGSVSYQDHTFTYGSWQNYNGTQHRRLRTCSACGYSDYEYANHSLSYGSWSSANASQHKRTLSCSCGYSTTEYADHTLTVSRQSISDTQHKVTSKCSVCGYSSTVNEAHSFSYGDWQSCSDAQHRRTKSCECGYSGYDYGDHHDSDGDGQCDDCGYLMSRFSVTVPANLSLTVSQDGTVHAAVNAAIVNNSTGAVKVTAVTVRAGSGWTLVPYSTNMANSKVDTKQIGFTINNAATKQTGSSEALTLGSGWNIAKNADLPLDYDAVVSAMSEPVNEQVLTLIFVLDWAN